MSRPSIESLLMLQEAMRQNQEAIRRMGAKAVGIAERTANAMSGIMLKGPERPSRGACVAKTLREYGEWRRKGFRRFRRKALPAKKAVDLLGQIFDHAGALHENWTQDFFRPLPLQLDKQIMCRRCGMWHPVDQTTVQGSELHYRYRCPEDAPGEFRVHAQRWTQSGP